MQDDILYWLASTKLPEFAIEDALLVLGKFGSLKTAWKADKEVLKGIKGSQRLSKAILNHKSPSIIDECKEIVNWAEKESIHIIPYMSQDYPRLLREANNPPPTLFVKGDPKIMHNKTIAMVGTRDPSEYGKSASRRIASELVRLGYVVVSGLAFGIDESAHKGVLDEDGLTIAVLASSVDNVTPKSNKELANNILRGGGCLVSEYGPKEPIRRGNFVERNRIIAGLSNATIVVEGTKNSGTRHQATYAKEMERPIFVVEPENREIEQAELPLILIDEGAISVRSGPEAVRELWMTRLDKGETELKAA
ncbi:MAG: DNA-processing protein DprA [Candidatus Thorarchaeota archaeon]